MAITSEEAQQVLTWAEWWDFPQSQLAVLGTVIAVVAAAAGWFSFAAAWRSGNLAKKNLKVDERALELNTTAAIDANKRLIPDFTNAIEVRGHSGNCYVFDIEISNPATRANTVKAAPLTLLFADDAERVFTPKPIPPEAGEKSPLQLPLELPGASHRIGSLAYDVPADFLRGRLIRRYRIDFIDSNDRTSSIETIAVNRQR